MSRDLFLVVFDCDGTLVDSQHVIVAAMEAAFRAHDLPPLPREDVLGIVGLSLDEAVSTLLPDGSRALITGVRDAYKNGFADILERPDLAEPLYDGARETLARLCDHEDLVLGVATGKSDRGLARILAEHELTDHFVTLQTADHSPSKPHPGMLERAMREAGARPERTVIIGDTSFDMMMGRNAGAACLGVNWGYHDHSRLVEAGAHSVLDRFSQVAPALGALWALDDL